MLILSETPAGFGLFECDKKLEKQSPESYADCLDENVIKLKHFQNFIDTEQAVSEHLALNNAENIPPLLKSFLKKKLKKENNKLIVGDKKLVKLIKNEFKDKVNVIFHNKNKEIMRFINTNFTKLVEGITEEEMNSLAVSLSHGMTRLNLQFTPEKVDQMVIQAVSLVDDLDKETNTLGMRLKEWFGWHFPESSKLITDTKAFADFILLVGTRENVCNIGEELEDLLGEDCAASIRKIAAISNFSSLQTEDVDMIKEVARNVKALLDYKKELMLYLNQRMTAIAPNLTCMVGELVAARLIAHAGSLVELSKRPASTVQVFGAEKALFRAIKQRKPTPKYGLIYHVKQIGQASPEVKGTIARVLSNKLALCARVDAMGAKIGDEPTIGMKSRSFLETKLEELNGQVANGTYTKKRPAYKQMAFKNERSSQFNKRPKY